MPIKERGSTGIIGGRCTVTVYRNPTTIYRDLPYTVGCYTPNSYARISSEEPQFKHFGACNHHKVEATFDHSEISWYAYGYLHTDSDRLYRFAAAGLQYLPDFHPDLNALSAEAYLAMKPSLSSGFSLTNFLFELKDFKSLFKLFDPRKSLSRNIGGGYLNYQFGWKLLIQDLMEIKAKLDNWKDLLADYIAKQNQPLVRHWRKNFEPEEGANIRAVPGTCSWHTNYKRKSTFNATMKYSYRIKGLNQAYLKAKALSDMFGLKLNASVIWNALPFSFVVDWFINVGDYLDSLSEDFLESIVTIEDFCVSVKTVTEYEHVGYNLYSSNPTKSYSLGKEHWSQYSRLRCLPNASDFGLTLSHRYGSKQMLLSAAILHS